MMNYPTLEEVEQADRRELAKWYRFLKSPGMAAVGRQNFQAALEAEGKVMDRIVARFKAMGMFTPEISKSIGWEAR
jgi:hypothetical protein